VREFAAYDAVTDTWEILPDLPDIQRNHGPAAGVGGIFYVLGGRSGRPTIPRRACSIASTRTIRPRGRGARRRRCRAPAVGRRRV
jgi:hypothetical protein